MFRIVGGPAAATTHIYDEDGKEVRGITGISISISPGGATTAIFRVTNIELDLFINKEEVYVCKDK
ncbi:MAG: hypothetical protein JRC86_11505 [Deltaproteobacteria bacterium]|nr:hypothetical protein [Deltaproteobacteria bacterium]